MNRRNIFLIALIAVFCVILTGCGDNKTSVEPESSPIVYKTEKIQFHQISFDVPDQKEYGNYRKDVTSTYPPQDWIQYTFYGTTPVRQVNVTAESLSFYSNPAGHYLNDPEAKIETITLNGSEFTRCSYSGAKQSESTSMPPRYWCRNVYVLQNEDVCYTIVYEEDSLTTPNPLFLAQFEASLRYDSNAAF